MDREFESIRKLWTSCNKKKESSIRSRVWQVCTFFTIVSIYLSLYIHLYPFYLSISIHSRSVRLISVCGLNGLLVDQVDKSVYVDTSFILRFIEPPRKRTIRAHWYLLSRKCFGIFFSDQFFIYEVKRYTCVHEWNALCSILCFRSDIYSC